MEEPEFVHHLMHHHELTPDEALAAARKAAAEARKDRAGLEKWESGKNDNPQYGIPAIIMAGCPYC